VDKDIHTYILGLLTMTYAVMNLGILSYTGQQLIRSSDKVFVGTYNCNWFEQSPKFQSSLLIVREVATKGLCIIIPGGWTLNHETFINVRSSLFPLAKID
jgi:hypothetical protein